MAKKNYGIADAIRKEIKTPAPVAAPEELDVVQTELDIPAQTETVSAAAENVAPKKKAGRPRKTPEGAPERSTYSRVTLEPSLKTKLQVICAQRGLSENDYLYAIVSKAIEKDFERAFTSLSSDN